jgi:DNA-binding MarR family transcriptional regulator
VSEVSAGTPSATTASAPSATGLERQRQIEAAIAGLNALWDYGGPEVPAWVAHELTFSQMRLLFLLGKNAPVPVSRVAEWLGVGLPTASGAIDRLERHGLVTRQHSLDDRRVVECLLTGDGRKLIEQIYGMRTDIVRRFLEVLTEEELGEMARLITIVHDRIQAQHEAVPPADGGLANSSPASRVQTSDIR